ncbi:variant erythrocyte surface antigen-1 family protein [Babesia caballi]|uniref:Variant erythrocyte surface antigen-1 family protein n=1 Tax=Babesia caballi TaxID=5871 RepID=A0AAV4LPX8_BABCB|nr:variant erythrocyte surface antigen-1 family protein [Babesia caballi]
MSNSGTALTECPSNLKEAIDWILRVTGKDGQDSGGTEGLAKHVHALLTTAIGESSGLDLNGKDTDAIQKLSEWLAQDHTKINQLIDSLASGLATFIGYENGNNQNLIGVDGIAVSNDPLERLRDAVLGFLAGFLGQLKGVLKSNMSQISKAVTTLNGGIGKGQQGFSTAIQGAENALKGVKASSITNVWNHLKNVNNLNVSNIGQLSTAFQSYLKAVLKAVEDDGSVKGQKTQTAPVKTVVQKLSAQFSILVNQVGIQHGPINLGSNGLGNHIKSFQTDNAYLQPNQVKNLQSQAKALVSAAYSAAYHFLAQLQRQYVTTEHEAPKPGAITPIHGRIFLGCLPLYFYGVTYLYWRCNGNNGWKALTFNGGQGGFDLKWYMQAMGFEPSSLNVNKKGSEFVSTAFKGFDIAATAASPSTPRYFTFLSELRNKVGAYGSDLTRCPLFGLYHVARLYFRHLQSLKVTKETAFPHTIRAILYWMAGLQFSPDYEYLLGRISNIFMNLVNKLPSTKESEPTLQIADSARNALHSLTPSYVKGYLVATCLYIPSLLSSIQGAEKSGATDEPFLHKLYSNGLNLMYPSGASLFNALCDCVYALQFEFSFLYHMCANAYDYGYAWLYCRFGHGVHPLQGSSTPALSHLCTGYTCNGAPGCDHTGKGGRPNCMHNRNADCGKSSSQPSPLQAFLTDKLTGFCLELPGNSKHMEKHPTGYMCHVPMGFDGHLRADSKRGGNLNYILQPFCGGSTSPLRQLGEKLLCISRRTPKTLADLFGFYWNLNRVWEKDIATSGSLKQLIEGTVEYTIARRCNSSLSLTSPIGGLVRHCHEIETSNGPPKINITKHNSTSSPTPSHNCKKTPADLWSLCESVSTAHNNQDRHKDCRAAKCGGYLYPLTVSTGAAFGKSELFASTYLSWLVYMGEHFSDWLQEFLDEFNSLKCSNCKHDPNCTAHEPGKHSYECKCPSIPRCSDVLPLFYAYGFTFGSANTLMGGGRGPNRGDDQTLRSCDKFFQQLTAVLSPTAPLQYLLNEVDYFMYAVRKMFLMIAGPVWTLAAITLLYNYILKLDLLHIKSHLHFPSTHKILPSALLTAGKTTALKKLIYYMP